MKKIVFAVVLLMAASSSSASVRSIYQSQSTRFLHEKVGCAENLLDNPAQLSRITQVVVEDDVNVLLQTVKPYDVVFDKENHDDAISNDSQAIVPVGPWFCLNVGYGYSQFVESQESISALDNTYIRAADKTFEKIINAGIASSQVLDTLLGYSFERHEKNHFVDYASDLASDYTYANESQFMKHQVGLIYHGYEVYGGLATMQTQGAYQFVREIEYSLESWEINVRRIFGELGQENILVQAGMATHQLNQTLFEMGREGYDLDIPNNDMMVSGYYYHPIGSMELALGIEFQYHDRTIFSMDGYTWTNYQTVAGTIPAEIRAQVWPWLALWLEMRLQHQENTYEKKRNTRLASIFGANITMDMLEIQMYTLPGFTLTQSETSDTIQDIQVGINAILRF